MSVLLRERTSRFRWFQPVRKIGKTGLVATLLVLTVALVSSSPVYAANCGETGAPACVSDIIPVLENIIKLLAPAAAIAFLVMVLIGAFKFLTSGGDPKSTASARSTLTYAILGIILVIAVWLILLLVKELTDVPITNVNLPI